MNVRLTQIDGSIPNLALMRLSAYHRSRGDSVTYTTDVRRGLFEPEYGRVYGSAVFQSSQIKVMQFEREWPGCIVGGTGTPYKRTRELIGLQRWVVGAYDKRFSWRAWQQAGFRPENLGAAA